MNWTEIIAAHGLSLLVTLVGGAMAWQKIKDRSNENQRRIEQLETRCDGHDEFTAKLAAICIDLQWIKKTLDDYCRRSYGSGGSNHQRDQDDS